MLVITKIVETMPIKLHYNLNFLAYIPKGLQNNRLTS